MQRQTLSIKTLQTPYNSDSRGQIPHCQPLMPDPLRLLSQLAPSLKSHGAHKGLLAEHSMPFKWWFEFWLGKIMKHRILKCSNTITRLRIRTYYEPTRDTSSWPSLPPSQPLTWSYTSSQMPSETWQVWLALDQKRSQIQSHRSSQRMPCQQLS